MKKLDELKFVLAKCKPVKRHESCEGCYTYLVSLLMSDLLHYANYKFEAQFHEGDKRKTYIGAMKRVTENIYRLQYIADTIGVRINVLWEKRTVEIKNVKP